MQFEWDEVKRQENIRKHKVDFVDVSSVFSGPMLAALDERQEYGEERWIGFGMIEEIVVAICWTEPEEGRFRIISARKATKHEREMYERFLAH